MCPDNTDQLVHIYSLISLLSLLGVPGAFKQTRNSWNGYVATAGSTEEEAKIYIQDGGHGSHHGFLIRIILAIFVL